MFAVLRAALVACVLCVTTAGQAAAGEVIVVRITDLAFSPATVNARVGETIEWVNEDFLDHTATADDASFDLAVGVDMSARLEVKRSGSVSYFCRVHPNMRGTIDVE